MKEKKIYYIYTLTDPISNEIKYVGKTRDLKNRFYRHLSSYYLKESWTPKNKWILNLKNNNLKPLMEILDIGDEYNIDSLEIYWISQLKAWGIKLKNETVGGDGFSWSGRRHKVESVEKMKMNHPFRREVIQYDLNSGKLINKYDSIHEAAESTGLHRGHISKCCSGKKHYHSVGNYYFRFSDDNFPQTQNKFKSKKVYQILNDEIIKIYNSVYELRKINGEFNSESVRYHLNKSTMYKGYYWRTSV